jgi:DNA (cytosine-5-)-methyltransferase|nr:MAG TPA: Cytosine specific methyltransferase [Caudoviricetes sp.]
MTEYTAENPLRLIELFAGIGSQTQALTNIGIAHRVVAISEIDKYAIQSYEAMHGKANNLGDIRKIEELPDADLWTYSFPCQDISVAGKGAGIKEGTRSGLLFEVERLLRVASEKGTLPKYLLLENVKNLVSKKFKADFDKWLDFLAELGYTNYWKVLNAKDYGIPQNRERVFCVSIRGEHKPFVFPKPKELTIRLRDMIDEMVEEKFYLKENTIRSILRSTFNSRRDSIRPGDGLANTLLARDWRGPQCVQVGEVVGEKWDKMHDISKRVYEPDGIAPTVHCQQGGNTELKIAEDFVLGGLQKHQTPRTDGISPTLTEAMGKGGGQTPIIIDTAEPKERFYKQAFETLKENECKVGDTIDAFNKKVNKSGVCPTLTTRPEGFKTAILPVVGAMRGRNPEDPSDRTAGVPTEQRLEINEKGLCNALTTVQKDNLVIEEDKTDYVSRRYNEFIEEKGYVPEMFVAYNKTEIKDVAPTLTGQCSSPSGSSAVLKLETPVKVNVANKKGYEEANPGDYVNITYPGSKTKRGRVGNGVAHTLTCGDGNAVITENVRIRKLTPRECLRLMGWKDEQIDKIVAAKISGTQQYRQAGNGIVVQVLESIFKALFLGEIE